MESSCKMPIVEESQESAAKRPKNTEPPITPSHNTSGTILRRGRRPRIHPVPEVTLILQIILSF